MRDLTRRRAIDLDGDVELVATECVTNAVRASGGALDDGPDPGGGARRLSYSEQAGLPVVRLMLAHDAAGGELVLAVWDRCQAPPVVQACDEEATGGRGLLLVTALCRRWGWYWPANPVRDGSPWPGPAAGEMYYSGHGKVVWGAFDLRPGS